MFGGLTKTSSRIAIAAALGLVVGGFAFKATPARAADLGGDCCADLEERVAELEATTVRKGNKKVSVTLSGWVIKSFNWWDDGDISSAYVGDKGYDLGSRFAITGSATIAPGWSAGYNLTVQRLVPSSPPAARAGFRLRIQSVWRSGGPRCRRHSSFGSINPLYSFIYIKSDRWGTLNWGHLSPASDNQVVLADISGTVIEFELGVLRGRELLPASQGRQDWRLWRPVTGCLGRLPAAARALGAGSGNGLLRRGAACGSLRLTDLGRLPFQTSWGKQEALNEPRSTSEPDSNFWDFAVLYTADWNSIKLSAAYAYTWMESAAATLAVLFRVLQRRLWQRDCFRDQNTLRTITCTRSARSILHKPSGLGIFGQYSMRKRGGSSSLTSSAAELPSTSVGWSDHQSRAFTDQQSRDEYLVREAVLAEGLGIYERGGARLPWRDHAVRRVWSI